MSLRYLQLPSTITDKLGVPPVVDMTDNLPKNPKNTWSQLAGTRNIADLTTIALHHDAWPKKNTVGKYTDMQLAAKMAYDHIANTSYDKTGEGGIPYHIWIRNGRIYQCNDLLDRVYGVGSNNAYTVHICVSGDYFNYDTLTDSDRNALYAAILMVKSILPNFKEIKAHKDFPSNKTDCPGYDVKRVKADVANIEMQLKAVADPSQIKVNAYKSTEQHRYLYNQYISDPVNNKWLEPHLLKLHEFMKDNGMYFGS